jgi:hypothetical protein
LGFIRRVIDGCIHSVLNTLSLLWATRDNLEAQASEWMSNYRSCEVTAEEAQEEYEQKRHTGKFANYIGKRAYFHFGVRPKNGANVKVTRKWIRNLLDDKYHSLRMQDKINIIDEALFLSFIPSDVYVASEELASSNVYMEELSWDNSSS